MTDSLLESFVSEARELLQSAATALLILEKHRDDEAAINDLFRSVHTLKGSVGLFDFPAFIKLVHVGEDVLSAVRDGQLELTSALVDMLLDALDQVGAWVDEIATVGALSTGADGVSKDMTAGLRRVLPADCGSQAPVSATRTGDLATVAWLAAVPESDRLSSFVAAIAGTEVFAVEYVPAEDCFFSGEDPFILFRQITGLHSLTIEPTEAWASIDAGDPYRCILRFRALVAAPRPDVEALFRYVVEQVAMAAVPPHALILVSGDSTCDPVAAEFVAAARHLTETADWHALRHLVDSLLQATAPALLSASALRGLKAVLAAPFPDPDWVTALVDCLEKGEADPHPLPLPAAASDPEGPMPAPTAASRGTGQGTVTGLGKISPTAARILATQRIILYLPLPAGGLAECLDPVARTVSNVLAAEGRRHDDAAVWSVAVDAARVQEKVAPVLEVLDRWLALDEADGLAGAATSASGDRSQQPRQGAGEPVSLGTLQVNRVLKVDQGKIDALMNLIGELLVSKNSLPFMARRAEQVHGSREMSREIKDLHAVIDRLAQEMQSAIMAVRMLPVSDVFDRFPRLVRDVSRKLGKQIDLVIEGADTAADKNIIEALNDPLLHIVRNAIDHGVESPEDRDDVGKPTRATVRLRAFQESDRVVIEVTDDGRGIDPENIKRSALSKGIIDEERAARLTDQEAVNLVFTPGFSTVAEVSDLSGRGVGMDVVVNGVQKAGGSVAVTSVKDVGTTVRLALPLSMAVTRVMVVEACGGMLFGIPMDQIAATVRVHRDEVRRLKQSEAFVLRDAIVPLIRLDRLLQMEPPPGVGDCNEEDAVLVVRSSGGLVGLVVDQFHEGMDIILKPFNGILANIQGYSGSALLGDGRVLLVLNLKEHL
jgi:two-component system, chemotaxis family, sensor kinase CheA